MCNWENPNENYIITFAMGYVKIWISPTKNPPMVGGKRKGEGKGEPLDPLRWVCRALDTDSLRMRISLSKALCLASRLQGPWRLQRRLQSGRRALCRLREC